MQRVNTVLVGILVQTIRILGFREPSTAIVLGTATTLFVAKVLAGSRSKESCKIDESAYTLPAGLVTHQHALRSLRFVSSLMDCLVVGNLLPLLPVDYCQRRKAMYNQYICCFRVFLNTHKTYLWTEARILKHHRAVAEFLNKTVPALNRYERSTRYQ